MNILTVQKSTFIALMCLFLASCGGNSGTNPANPANARPTASPQSVTLLQNQTTSIILQGTVNSGTIASYQIVSSTSNGAITGNGQRLHYTPLTNYSGTDAFTFTVTNNEGIISAEATVSIVVIEVEVDTSPNSTRAVSVEQDGSITIPLIDSGSVGTDGDGSGGGDTSFSFQISMTPSNGDVIISEDGQDLIYIPNEGFNGTDSFTFIVLGDESDASTLTLVIIEIGDGVERSGDGNGDDDGDDGNGDDSNGDDGNGDDGNGDDGSGDDGNGDDGSDDDDGVIIGIDDGSDPTPNPTGIPTASDQSVVVEQNSSITITLVGNDIEGAVVSFELVKLAASGSLRGEGAIQLYTPDIDFSGNDSFTFSVTDSDGNVSPVGQVSIEVTPITPPTSTPPVNPPPIALTQTITIHDYVFSDIILTATDTGGGIASYQIILEPSNGELDDSSIPSLVYRSNLGFKGNDFFTFRVTDDAGVESEEVGVSIIIVPNLKPIATTQSVTVNQYDSITITLSGEDSDGEIVSYQISRPPSNGVLSGAETNQIYTPTNGYNGTDFFEFTVIDDDGEVSKAGRITIEVVNDIPTASTQSVTVARNSSIEITLSGNDPDGTIDSYQISKTPIYGQLSAVEGDKITYTPFLNIDFTGIDSIEFTVKDDDGDVSISAEVRILIVNVVPVATALSVTVNQNETVTITLVGEDIDGTTTSFQLVSIPSNGDLSGDTPVLTYTPAIGFSGNDSFTYSVTDIDDEVSEAALVTIIITPNIAPSASTQSATVNQNETVTITLAGEDSDGTTTSFQIVSPPSNGVLSGDTPVLTYTPKYGFSGNDSFTYSVIDNDDEASEAALVSIVITPNIAPTVTAQSVTVDRNSSITITLEGIDDDGTIDSYQVSSDPTKGELSAIDDNQIIYTPTLNSGYTGTDSFEFTVTDDDGAVSNIAEVSILIVNAVPKAIAQTVRVKHGETIIITLEGTDSDGSIASYQLNDLPASGTLTSHVTEQNQIIQNQFIYLPHSFETDIFTMTFSVTDNDGTESALATIDINARSTISLSTSRQIDEGDLDTSIWQLIFRLDPRPDTASIDYQIIAGSASSSDYSVDADEATLDFNATDTASINITLYGDILIEDDKTLTLTLSKPANLQDPDITTYTLVITNDDEGFIQDTGIEFGAGKIGQDCSGDHIEVQDCSHGRDAQAAESPTTLIKVGGGAAGFDFTKLGADGTELAIQTATYSATGNEIDGTIWSCVRDNYTGWVWEVKTSGDSSEEEITLTNPDNSTQTQTVFSDPHHRDNTYRWGGVTAIGRDADPQRGNYYDDWNRLVNAANDGDGLCGYNDWRVPRVDTLSSIVNRGVIAPNSPTIDANYFPNTLNKPNDYFLASIPYARNNTQGWAMRFGSRGEDFIVDRSDFHYVRLVRGARNANWEDNRYQVTEGRICDRATGLMWQQGSESKHSFTEALDIAVTSDFGDFTDWRLPNTKELRSLVAYDRAGPAINISIFTNTKEGNYITSSTNLLSLGSFSLYIISVIDFTDGTDNEASETNDSSYVRLVRTATEAECFSTNQ